MAQTVQFLVGQLDFTPYVDIDSVSVDNNIIMTSDTMDCNFIFDPDSDHLTNVSTGATVSATRPICGQEIIWQNPNVMVAAPDPNGANRMAYREFGGIIVEVKEDIDGMHLVYQVHAKSYEHWLNRHLCIGWFQQGEPSGIVKQIIQQFAPSFTTYNCQTTNTTVIPQYFDYSTVSDSIKNISDQLEYGYYVDYYKDLHFYAAESFTTPLANNTLNADTDLTVGDLELTETSDQQYNKIFIKGFKTRSSDFMILLFNGDGQTTQWSTGYRMSSITKPVPDVSCVVYPSMAAYQADTQFINGGSPQFPQGGRQMALARDIVDGAPSQANTANTCFIHYTQHLARVTNYTGGTAVTGANGLTFYAIPTGSVLAIRAHYMKDMTYLGQDPQAQSITSQTEGTDGVYEYCHVDKSLTNSTLTAVQAKAMLLLAKYRYPQKGGQFSIFFNATNAAGFRAGQYFNFNTTRRFGGLNDTMYIQRVTKTLVKNDSSGLVTKYLVEFADSPYLV